jgi:hypothetical protein
MQNKSRNLFIIILLLTISLSGCVHRRPHRPHPGHPSPTPHPASERQPDLVISEFKLTPAVPVKGQPVHVRIGVYNQGSAPAGPFTVKWWAGENYPDPACAWNIDRMNARGGRILTCTYAGYPSRYARINTKAKADTGNTVHESAENNNMRRKRIRVARP